jgi:hypothetical protein
MGTDKKTLLEKLPEYFSEFRPPDNLDTVTQIWKVTDFNLPKYRRLEMKGLTTNLSFPGFS